MPASINSLQFEDIPTVSWDISAANPINSDTTYLWLVNVPNITFAADAAFGADLNTLAFINNLSQAQVDLVLSKLYAAFPTRTAVNGTITVAGTNAAPSGILQAACPPTTGKEYAYELKNDSCAVSANHWTTVTTN
jgi:hypothetical protein